MRRAGIRLADLAEPEARVSLTNYLALMEAAVALSGDPAFALRFGASARTEGTSIAWLIAASAETVEAGHRELNRYARLVLDEGDHRSAMLLPASAQVVLVGGNIERDTFVKIRYQAKVLLMLSEDLRCGIGLVSDHSRS